MRKLKVAIITWLGLIPQLSYAQHQFDLSLHGSKELPKVEIPAHYTHKATLKVYIHQHRQEEIARITHDVKMAQEKLDQCHIYLELEKIYIYKSSLNFLEFESMAFNSGRLTPYELSFFSLVPPKSTGVLLVDSMDWTIDDHGTIAVGYGPYILNLPDYMRDPHDREFFKKNMLGYSVMSKARKKWTLLHEVGHSIMNLEHEDDPNNIMFPYDFARHPNPSFTPKQCQKAYENTDYLKPLKGNSQKGNSQQ